MRNNEERSLAFAHYFNREGEKVLKKSASKTAKGKLAFLKKKFSQLSSEEITSRAERQANQLKRK